MKRRLFKKVLGPPQANAIKIAHI